MFTSSGYFRGLNCPYFVNGLCERTYCHFRHSKQAQEKESTIQRSISKDAGDNSVPAVYGGPSSNYSNNQDKDAGEKASVAPKAILVIKDEEDTPVSSPSKVEDEDPSEDSDGGKIGPYGKYFPAAQYSPVTESGGASMSVQYTPTPISDLVNKPKPDKIVLTHAKGGAMLEYNPTPIVQLRQMQRKPTHRLRGKSAEGMEYDPESNFATVNEKGDSAASSRKRTISNDVDEIEYVPTKRNHREPVAEFSDEDDGTDKYEPGPVDDMPEYIPTSKTSDKYPVDPSISSNGSSSVSNTETTTRAGNSSETSTATSNSSDSRLSMADYLKLLLDPSKPSTSVNNKEFELKKKSKDLKSNSARSNSVKNDKNKQVNNRTSEKSHVQRTNSSVKSDKDSSNKSVKSSHKDRHSQNGRENGLTKSSQRHRNSSDGKSNRSHSDNHSNSQKEKSASSHKEKSINHSYKSSNSHSDKSSSRTDKSSSHTGKSSSHPDKSSSHSDKSNRRTDTSSNNHRSSSKSNNNESPKTESGCSKRHRSGSGSREKSRHSSENSSGHSKTRENSGSRNGNDSKDTLKDGQHVSRSNSCISNGPKEPKKLLNVTADLFGADSDASEDTFVQQRNSEFNGDEDSDDAFNGNDFDSDVDLPLDCSDLEEDVDTYEECLRIFNESKHNVKLPNKGKQPVKREVEEEDGQDSMAKKRVAHKAEAKTVKKIKERPMSKLSPAQVMHNRFVQMQKRALEAAQNNQSNKPSTSGLSGKSRLAHGASLAARQKEKLTITTASKTEKRKAHAPVAVSLPRPTVPADFGSKIPTNVRQRYLNLIIDECLKLCKTEKEAYDRALEEEQSCYNRASSKNIYLNVSVNMIKKLRVEIANSKSQKSAKANPSTTLSHQAMLGGLKATQISYTLNRSHAAPKAQTEDFLGADLYKRLQEYILNEEQLVENGFPRWDPNNPGTPQIKERDWGKGSPSKASIKGNHKLCVRCGKRFEVYPNGKYAYKEECVFHWGKALKRRIAGAIEARYTCCSSELEVKGCEVCQLHVYDSNKFENLTGFMRTLPCSPPIDGDYGTYAMDCEMVYTHGGCELARVTVIAPDRSAIYESLVKPDKPVIDYNTRFSGLTAEDMKGVTTSLRDVQAVLLSLFTDRTILMGHSLESDLIALKLIHSTVVDTSVVFPHRLGPPFKRALKTLMAEYLKKIIQDDVGGHDSHEDAASCLELMQLKLKEDAKRNVRRN